MAGRESDRKNKLPCNNKADQKLSAVVMLNQEKS